MAVIYSEAGPPDSPHRGIESTFELAEGVVDESAPFILGAEDEEPQPWSPRSLGPGFIWIETGQYKHSSAPSPADFYQLGNRPICEINKADLSTQPYSAMSSSLVSMAQSQPPLMQ
jgi:hypothetical protein